MTSSKAYQYSLLRGYWYPLRLDNIASPLPLTLLS